LNPPGKIRVPTQTEVSLPGEKKAGRRKQVIREFIQVL
jgi:hypothetical protein